MMLMITGNNNVVDENGEDCREIEIPDSRCDGNPEILSFTFEPRSCGDVIFVPDGVVCEDFEDFGTIAIANDSSEVVCRRTTSREEEDGMVIVVFDQEVQAGDLIVIPMNGIDICELTCDIISFGSVVQSLDWTKETTCGEEELFLKDIYGSLQLEGCGSGSGNDQNCLKEVEYTYTIENIHNLPMEVTLLERMRFTRRVDANAINGESESSGGTETIDLIDKIEVEDRFLEPGETTEAIENDVIDVCAEGEYETTVRVKADPPEGIPCQDEDMYVILTEPLKDCRVDLDITCETRTSDDAEDSGGRVECTEIDAPEPICEGNIEEINFTYLGTDCSNSFNSQPTLILIESSGDDEDEDDEDEDESLLQCEDFDGGPEGNMAVSVLCIDGTSFDDDVTVIVSVNRVAVGQSFAVPAPGAGPMPDVIVCEIQEGRIKKQTVTILSSNNDNNNNQEEEPTHATRLALKDRFGSLQVESCNNEQNCLVPITYTYTINNVGQTPMELTRLERTVSDDTAPMDLLPEVDDDDRTFGVGESRVVYEEDDILDVCVESEVVVVGVVEADPPEGVPCLDVDEYVIPTIPDKFCRVDAEVTCTSSNSNGIGNGIGNGDDDDDQDCDDIPPPERFNCNVNDNDNDNDNDCVESLTFTYVGRNCREDFNGQEDSCKDFGIGPGINSRIICTNEFNRVKFRDTVTIGDRVVIDSAEEEEEEEEEEGKVLNCELFDTENGERTQELTLNLCGDVSLKSVYGALQLEGCDELTCLVDITYVYRIQNVGTDEMDVTRVERIRNGQTLSLLDDDNDNDNDNDNILNVGEFTEIEEDDILDVCTTSVEAEICTKLVVEVDPPEVEGEGELCLDVDEYCIVTDSNPTLPPTQTPTPPPTEPPTPSPTPPPTPPPTPLPSRVDSNPPETDPPTDPPTPLPTPLPTPTPTTPPFEDPSPSPSQMPSPVDDGCYISVDADCTPSGESNDCGSVVVTRTRCEDRPLAMVFRYNGGLCDQSDNIQNSELFQCFDFQEGPPVNAGDESYITVTDIKGGSIIYHADTVRVGGEYTVLDEPFQVEANMNITTWRNDNTIPQNILQTLVFHSSCSQNLFLKDRFGAHQLVVFVNEEQGLRSCFFNATFNLNIANDVQGTGAILQRLSSNTNYGLFNFTNEVNGIFLEPGETLSPSPSFDVVIDLTVVTNNVIFTSVLARSEEGFQCSDSDFLAFVTGLALPPNVPTRAPTGAPTRTPLPTPDPQDTACSLQSIVQCDVTNAAGLFECDNIVPPISTECTSGGFPREVEFIYRGGNCIDSSTPQEFFCNGAADLEEVWITIISGNNNILWNRITTRNEFMDLRGIDESIDVTISTVENRRVGDELQSMTFNTTCTAASQLRLKDTFGALQLVEFTTLDGDDATVNAAFANVEITYAVELEGGTSTRARLVSATSTGGPSNEELDVTDYDPPAEVLGPRDTHVFGTAGIVLDLMNGSTEGVDYSYVLEVNADSASNPDLPCSNTDRVDFTVE
eukprot:CAMPEP_0178934710 /NCGR_PEP_ID=MMETSP0786-20121207/24037_1 /TAXON_ID=186022 /ORGANISM="Thalassionema frauenfeldii, Strain CCMP 1798" /LENGTH=1502 /DNA_ID=CAMNT_0020612569 /DNA_START=1215 /DNA_END=5725 /DNA_ORIENTATION=-